MKFIIKLLIAANVLFSLNSIAGAEHLKLAIMKEIPEFCNEGTLWRKTIRSNSGSYCKNDKGASLAVYTCLSEEDFKKSKCYTNKDSKVKNYDKKSAKKFIEDNLNEVCVFIQDSFDAKVPYKDCSDAILHK